MPFIKVTNFSVVLDFVSNILLRLGSKNFFPLPIAAVKNQIIENSMNYFQILLYQYHYYNFVIQVKNISQLQLKD